MGNFPTHRAVIKVGEKKWDRIGAGWLKGQNISIQLESVPPLLNNGKMSFLLVPATKKQATAVDTTQAKTAVAATA